MYQFEQKGTYSKITYYAEDVVLRFIETLNSLNSLLLAIQTNRDVNYALTLFKTNFLTLILATEDFLKDPEKEMWYPLVAKETDVDKLIELFREYKKELVKSKVIDIRKLDIAPSYAFTD